MKKTEKQIGQTSVQPEWCGGKIETMEKLRKLVAV